MLHCFLYLTTYLKGEIEMNTANITRTCEMCKVSTIGIVEVGDPRYWDLPHEVGVQCADCAARYQDEIESLGWELFTGRVDFDSDIEMFLQYEDSDADMADALTAREILSDFGVGGDIGGGEYDR